MEDKELDNKRLIPLRIDNIGENKYHVKCNDTEYNIEGDEKSVRKAIYRIKGKDGDGKAKKRSSKNGTYVSMIGKDINVWKSKCPKSAEEFKSLMETTIELEKPYIIEGIKLKENTIMWIGE
jgi:hypothetical protein